MNSSICANGPNEVIEAIMKTKADAEKLSKFVNGGVNETVQLGEGSPTAVLRNIARKIQQSSVILDENDISEKTCTADGSTTPRTLGERFSDMVNVLDFGAVNDGTTDSLAAFNAAADAAGGRLVYIPAGSYHLSETPRGMFFSDGYVNTGNVEIALTDPGDLRSGEYVDELHFGLVGCFRRVPEFPSNSNAYVAQGMTTDGVKYLYAAQHYQNTYQYIVKYDIETRTIVSSTKFTQLYHANSLEYKGDELYVCGSGGENGIVVINPETMTIDRYITPPENITNLAWDETRNCWWSTSGNYLWRISEDFSTTLDTQTIVKYDGETNGQGLLCYEGLLVLPRLRGDLGDQKQRGHVAYVYDPMVKRFINKWDIPWGIGEIEEFCFYKGYIITTAAGAGNYYYFIYGAKFKKGFPPVFGPLFGEVERLPLNKSMMGTPQYCEIYVDASATSQGIGTAESPFNSLALAFVALNMTNHSLKRVHVKGDCTEGGYNDKFWFQGHHVLELVGWDGNTDNNIVPGISATQCTVFVASNITVRPYSRMSWTGGITAFLFLSQTKASLTGIKWDTSYYQETVAGLVYVSNNADLVLYSMDFSGVQSGICTTFLVRNTNGSQLHLRGQVSDFTIPSELEGFRCFDCKGLCDSYYTGFDSLVYKDNTIYAQNIISASEARVVPNS